MWFDVNAALAEILAEAPAKPANPAKQADPISNLAGLAGPEASKSQEAVAPVRLDPTPPEPASPGPDTVEDFPFGVSVGGRPLTSTGRIVSLEDRRKMSPAERRGPSEFCRSGDTGNWGRDQ